MSRWTRTTTCDTAETITSARTCPPKQRYVMTMKNLRIALLLLGVPIACRAAVAQSSGNPPDQPSSRVTQAHCRYSPNDPACQHHAQPTPASPRCLYPSPCPSAYCPYGYPPPSRPPWFFELENGNHAAAGALIGLGMGAALGASKDGNADSRLAGALVVGGLGALIGSAIGHGIPARHWHRHRHDWDDPEENAMLPPERAKMTRGRSRTTASSHRNGPRFGRKTGSQEALGVDPAS